MLDFQMNFHCLLVLRYADLRLFPLFFWSKLTQITILSNAIEIKKKCAKRAWCLCIERAEKPFDVIACVAHLHSTRVAFHFVIRTVWISYNHFYTPKLLVKMREIIKKYTYTGKIPFNTHFSCVFYCYRIYHKAHKCNTQCLRLFIYSFICWRFYHRLF